MISTYCGSFSQEEFRKHIEECEVCFTDAEGRSDLDFSTEMVWDPRLGPKPTRDPEDTSRIACPRCGRGDAMAENNDALVRYPVTSWMITEHGEPLPDSYGEPEIVGGTSEVVDEKPYRCGWCSIDFETHELLDTQPDTKEAA